MRFFKVVFLCVAVLFLSACRHAASPSSGTAVSPEEVAGRLVFHGNGAASGSMVTLSGLAEGQEVALPENVFERNGYRFTGWAVTPDAGTPVYSDRQPFFTYSPAYNKDLYAVWAPEKETVTVSFDANGGEGVMAPLYARPGQSVCMPAPVFKSLSPLYKCGDGFGTTATDYVSYPTGRHFSVQEDTVFYAIWLPDQDYPGGSLRYRDTDVWVDGISVGTDDWKELKYLAGENFFMAVRNKNSGWYDVYQGFKNYCWAACASNAFHWWFDRNKSYLERYTYSGPSSLYGGFGKSDIYNYFTRYWPNEGGYPPAGFNWFLIGNSTVEGGAFFKDVFGNTGLQTEYTTPKQNNFSLSLEKALSAGEIIVLQVGEEQLAHAVTLWGARFDKDGFVDRIYITDSATTADGESFGYPGQEMGLIRPDVIYSGGNVYYSDKMTNANPIPVYKIWSFSTGEKYWEAYFSGNGSQP